MNENEKKTAPVVSMEAISAAVAEEVRAWEAESGSMPERENESPEIGGEERENKKSLFGAVAGLLGMEEEVDALKEAVAALERELSSLREEFAEERARRQKESDTLREQNERLSAELHRLRETDELIHMRIFDNRVRIGAVQEELEALQGDPLPAAEKEAAE